MTNHLSLSLSSNKFIVQIYSEYLNSRNITKTRLREETEKIENWLKRVTELREFARDAGYNKRKYITAFENPIKASKYLLEGLLPLYDNKLHELESTESEPYRPSKYQLYRKLQDSISHMNEWVGKGQTMSFHDMFIDDVYEQQISSFPQFEFIGASRITYQTESYLNLIYDLVFPFNNQYFDESSKCVKADALPPFFRQKGNPSN